MLSYMKTQRYVTTLIQRQSSEGWSDREMARQLGVHATTWHLIRHGQRGLGLSVLRRAMTRFPEYNGLAMLVLLSGVSVANADVMMGDTEAA